MPTAICNTCGELVTWVHRNGQNIKKQRCKCGSQDLTAVAGKYNADFTAFNYYDRRGTIRKHVPRVTLPTIQAQ